MRRSRPTLERFADCVTIPPFPHQVATVTSAVKLENEQQFMIAKKIQEMTGAKNIKLKPEVDPSLLGGFVVTVLLNDIVIFIIVVFVSIGLLLLLLLSLDVVHDDLIKNWNTN